MLPSILGLLLGFYLVLCGLTYIIQEKLIFHPKKLPDNYQFQFSNSFKERNITTRDGTLLNGLQFKVNKPKGLIFYLHGNEGALDTWGTIAQTYTNLHYDFFILDYRGFGKSKGKIYSEEQFYNDVQAAYDILKLDYLESNIVIIGYSIATGPAARLASQNKPKMLILKAPYYSLIDIAKHTYPFLPVFALKYKFKTYEFVQKTTAPIVIFHGEYDEIIYYGSSLKLKAYMKPADQLITLKDQMHNGIDENHDYITALYKLL